MKKFLKEMMGKSIIEIIKMAKAKGFEYEYHKATEDEFASIDFEVQGYECYICFDDKGIADEWCFECAE